jgi:predicted Zn-dependent protease
VLPGGKVFVYTGILPIAKTDDGLAAILGHEIAHNIARHSAESMSRDIIVTWPLRLIAMALDYSGVSGGGARLLFDLVIGPYGIVKPASRKQESEADYIGLMIMAKSCYDPQEAVGVWQRFEHMQGEHIPQWLSTHPSVSCLSTRLTYVLTMVECKSHRTDASLVTESGRCEK